MKRLYLFVLSCILLAIGGMTFNIAILQDTDTNPQLIEEASSTGEVSIPRNNEKEKEKIELPTEEQIAYERTLGSYGCAEVTTGQKSLAIDEYGICLVYPEEYYLKELVRDNLLSYVWILNFENSRPSYECVLANIRVFSKQSVSEFVEDELSSYPDIGSWNFVYSNEKFESIKKHLAGYTGDIDLSRAGEGVNSNMRKRLPDNGSKLRYQYLEVTAGDFIQKKISKVGELYFEINVLTNSHNMKMDYQYYTRCMELEHNKIEIKEL